jgi:RhtB (resistance to homoserine/threonine) family protein
VNAAELATLWTVFTVSLIVPGADFFCVVRESVAFGRRAGVLSALGVATALMIHTGYTVLGIGLLVSQSILLFNIIKWAGVAYLVFIGWKSLRAGTITDADVGGPDAPGSPHRTALRSFGIGFLTNLLNPKATLFFVALFTAIVSHQTPLAWQAGYGALLASCAAFWFALVAVFFTTPAIRAGFVLFGHWFSRITGLIFIGLGIRLALQRAP